MSVILIPLYELTDTIIGLYIWAVIISVILNWLLAFGVVNSYNPAVSKIGEFLFRITEPLLSPIRRSLPGIAGVDLSPFILILGLQLVRSILGRFVASLLLS